MWLSDEFRTLLDEAGLINFIQFFCERFSLVMPPLQVKINSFKHFLDFTWGSKYIKSSKNGSPCSVFWIFLFYLLKLNLVYENNFYCIWALLTKWSLPSLVTTPFWIFQKLWKLSVLLKLQARHVLRWRSKKILNLGTRMIFIHFNVLHCNLHLP